MTRFEKRLYVGFGILVALFTPILVGAFFVISQLEVTQGELLSKNAQDVISAERLSSLIHEEFGLVQGFVLRGQPTAVKQLETVHRDFQITASSLLLNTDVDEDPAILNEIRQLENESYALVKEAIAMKESGVSIEDINAYFEKNNFTRGARVIELVSKNVETQNRQLHEARSYADRVAKRLVLGLILACAFSLLATAAIVVLLWQMVRNKAREDRQIGERLKLELDLSNARKEAIEVVAHDLKNPLSALKMSHELLHDELATSIASNPDVAIGFQIAERSIQSMQRLIEDQLDHTKIEAGQLSLDKKIVNIADLIRDLELRFKPLMEDKGLSFSSKIDRGLFAEVDSARIDQLISNLLGNALKFTPEGGLVELIAKRRGSRLSIAVKDNGPGIAPDALKHIFERYWQVKETAKKGTGLGLSIAKGIAEAHGGKLICTSEPGHGAEFELTLQAADIAQPLRSSGPEMTH
jgi:signal transduction histidine kinase